MRPNTFVMAQELAPDWLGEARKQFASSWHPHTYIESLRSVGSPYIAANALMILSFVVAGFLIFRRTSPHLAMFSALAPVIFGATAMLVHILHLTHDLGDDYWSFLSTGHSIHVDALKQLRSIPFPFYLGGGMSFFNTVVLWLRRPKTNQKP
jgi:hypothetical protein